MVDIEYGMDTYKLHCKNVKHKCWNSNEKSRND